MFSWCSLYLFSITVARNSISVYSDLTVVDWKNNSSLALNFSVYTGSYRQDAAQNAHIFLTQNILRVKFECLSRLSPRKKSKKMANGHTFYETVGDQSFTDDNFIWNHGEWLIENFGIKMVTAVHFNRSISGTIHFQEPSIFTSVLLCA